MSIFYRISNHKYFIPKYLDNAQRFRFFNFTNIEAAIGEKFSRERFWMNSSQYQEILL